MRNLIYFVFASGVMTGFLVPALAKYMLSIPYLIGILLFFNFLDLKIRGLHFLRKELLVMVPLSALVMPLFVYFVLSTDLNPDYRAGLFFSAIAPTGIMILVLSRFVPNKDSALIAATFLATQLGTVLYLPLMVKWVLGATVEISMIALFKQTASLILLPYFMSRIFKRTVSENFIEQAKQISKWLLPPVVFAIISISIAGASADFAWNGDMPRMIIVVLAIYLIQGGLAYAFGYLFGDRSIRISMALCGSSRNIQLVMGIAILNFPPLTIIPMVIAIVLHHMTNVFWLWLFRK